jgi:protein TonB
MKAGPAAPAKPAVLSESFTSLSAMLAIALVFLGAGIAGAGRPVIDVPTETFAATPPEPVSVEDITMADLQGEPASEEAPLSAPPAEPPPPEQSEPPPEPEPVLTEKDIMPVPEPPALEPALRPLHPDTKERKPAPPQVRDTAPPAPAATAPGGQGGGGNQGAGTTRSSGGRGKFPTPPYPSFARSRGLTGTVMLNIRVAPSGDVNGVSVAGSTGSSQLDDYAASWVSRRWKWPAGAARAFRMPVTFRLR